VHICKCNIKIDTNHEENSCVIDCTVSELHRIVSLLAQAGFHQIWCLLASLQLLLICKHKQHSQAP